MHTLELCEVRKQFQNKEAVKNISIKLTNGVYGLLGENGAGKTTLLRMVSGILKPSAGQILCDGAEISQMGGVYRRMLGYLPQDFGYYPEFTAYRFLLYIAALKAIPKSEAKEIIDDLLVLVGLTDVKMKKLKTFSGGMLQRVGIAQALLNDPEILILDEPTAGLDPKERVHFRNIISALGKNKIIILSTHIVADIEYIADEILMMKSGNIIKKGTVQELSDLVNGHVWECVVTEKEADFLNQQYVVSNLRNQNGNIYLRIVSEEKPHEQAVLTDAVLEDAYLYYLGTRQERRGGEI